jgi:hypothetical protein
MAIIDTEPDILLIEDNDMEAGLLLRAFKKCNPEKNILWINDAEKALEYLGYDGKTGMGGSKPLLILLDLYLPKIHGFELLQKIGKMKINRYYEIIVVSGTGNEKEINKCYGFGAKAFIDKDILYGNCVRVIGGEEIGGQILPGQNLTEQLIS